MSIRKSTWQNLRRDGFRLSLTGRLGNRLSSCEDVEIGCAIQLASWKIRVEPRLQLQHYMTPTRLQWTYLRGLLRGVGEANVILDSYLFVSQSDHVDLLNRLRLCWWTRLAKEILYLIHSSRIAKLIGSSRRDMEGDDEVADIELRIGRLLGLLRLRSRYGQLRQDVARARWRRVDALADAASTRDCLEGGILLR